MSGFVRANTSVGLQRDSLSVLRDSLAQLPDSLNLISDSLSVLPDSTLTADSLKAKGFLNYPAFSKARDSVVKEFHDGKRMIYYYGDVSVKYGNLELKAEYMAYDMNTKTVFASGIKDTAGVLQGNPVMREGKEEYVMETIYHNFESRKSRITNMKTKEAEGIIHGKLLKKMPDNSINMSGGRYTVCDHEHPHFYLQLTKAKITNNPRTTVFGPAYLVVEDVPTPFALPFGFVPDRATRASGLMIPTFTEEATRGFALQGLGYYFVFGDHFDASITGDIYSLGSWNAVLTSRYKKRYKFDGTVNLNYSVNQVGEKGAPDFYQSKDFSVKWSHSQDPKSRPGTTFRASVNFATPMNNRFNSYDIQQSLQNQISSSVSYGKTFADSPFSLSVNMLHSQNSLDSSYAFTLPNMTLTMNRIYPFKSKDAAGKSKIYEDISLQYSTTLDNKINFKASDFGQPDFLSKFRSGMQHNFTIGLPSFDLFNYLQFSPGIRYGMNWHFQKNDKFYNAETNRIENNISDIFSHFGVTQDFSASLSLNTILYGMFNISERGKLRTIRHMVKPSVSISYTPELGTPANGYRVLNYIDNNGVQHQAEYNQYEGLLYGFPSKGRAAAMNFSLGNNFEAKIKSDRDTTNGGIKKIKLIDNLSMAGSYNFLADSMKLSNISVSMSTTIFGSLALNANANLDPYAINEFGVRYNRLNYLQEGWLNFARLTNASMSFSYQFSGDGKRRGDGKGLPEGKSGNNSDYIRVYNHPVTGEYIPGGWVYYLDPDNPWSVNINYNYSYSRSYQYVAGVLNTNHNHMQTLGVSAQLRMGRDLNVNINTGVDLTKMALTTTQLSATYDLHCFLISVSWVPNGMWESWSFRINAKASALADLLKFKKSASYWDRGGGF